MNEDLLSGDREVRRAARLRLLERMANADELLTREVEGKRLYRKLVEEEGPRPEMRRFAGYLMQNGWKMKEIKWLAGQIGEAVGK